MNNRCLKILIQGLHHLFLKTAEAHTVMAVDLNDNAFISQTEWNALMMIHPFLNAVFNDEAKE
ncbi:hypothetical protein T07_9909 [Trichinella nelsoni]|uniref:EF-hand domain-containing protein n=1 Tax=Trichinella nelsoni TaxID=6336 RepID=A0A0V0SB40_9BILA|nr:hypothetical protein T07_9909 [Trichinella nelsoni]